MTLMPGGFAKTYRRVKWMTRRRRWLLELLAAAIGLASFLAGFLFPHEFQLAFGSFIANAWSLFFASILVVSFGTARYLNDPRRIVFPLGVLALVVPLTLLQLGGTTGIVGFIPAGIVLLLLGVAFVFMLFPLERSDPLELTQEVLVSAITGTTPMRGRPEWVSVPLDLGEATSRAEVARYLRESRKVATIRTGGGRVTLEIGRIDPRRFSFLSHWWFLFGRTKIRLHPDHAEVLVDPRTYAFLERPGPYERYCRNIVSNLMALYHESGSPLRARKVPKDS